MLIVHCTPLILVDIGKTLDVGTVTRKATLISNVPNPRNSSVLVVERLTLLSLSVQTVGQKLVEKGTSITVEADSLPSHRTIKIGYIFSRNLKDPRPYLTVRIF